MLHRDSATHTYWGSTAATTATAKSPTQARHVGLLLTLHRHGKRAHTQAHTCTCTHTHTFILLIMQKGSKP